MADSIMMTHSGFVALKEELDFLKSVKRNEISEKIRIARGFGDLSENSEYDEAKNEQAKMEARIALLEEQLKYAKVIDDEAITTDVVSVGVIVTLEDIEFHECMEYKVVSAAEPSKDDDTITNESPVGMAILGHRVGDIVDVDAPVGSIQFKILDIKK